MYTYLSCIYIIVINFTLITSVWSWDTTQMEVFDVVEEINENFYNILNISQDADLSTIKKAFRGQSLILHPDKNSEPDAEVKFRNLVSVYEVLRDSEKRAYYDDVLKNGLPNWKSAVYYYRHVRKMGLAETICTLFVIITIGQYLVAWGTYVEKKYTVEQLYGAKIKKQERKKGVVSSELVELLQVPKPSFRNTLPIQIPIILWYSIKEIGPTITRISIWLNEYKNKKQKQDNECSSENESVDVRIKPAKKRKPGFIPMERDDSELPPRLHHIHSSENDTAPVVVTGGLWTDDDLAELTQLVNKYPGGTPDRWEKIADIMNRSVIEVTYMANKLKENLSKLSSQEDESQPEQEVPKKQKTRGGKLGKILSDNLETNDTTNSQSSSAVWTQLQQKALETALAKYPKGPADRWDKIAKCVPNKTKEECIMRYKYLVEVVRKQKEKKENTET